MTTVVYPVQLGTRWHKERRNIWWELEKQWPWKKQTKFETFNESTWM